MPVLLTAPLVEKRAKFAAVPKLIDCPKIAFGINNRKAAVNVVINFVFILFVLLPVKESPLLSKGTGCG